MSRSSFWLLLDENQERQAGQLLEERGHDVELAVDVLKPGVSDERVAEYAEETGRVVVTADDDFLSMGFPTEARFIYV